MGEQVRTIYVHGILERVMLYTTPTFRSHPPKAYVAWSFIVFDAWYTPPPHLPPILLKPIAWSLIVFGFWDHAT